MFPTSQMPEKSGRPSAILGAGAERFGLPSGNRGMPAVGCLTHCALVAAVSDTRTAMVTSAGRRVMSVLLRVRISRARRFAFDATDRQGSRLLTPPRTGAGRDNRTGSTPPYRAA